MAKQKTATKTSKRASTRVKKGKAVSKKQVNASTKGRNVHNGMKVYVERLHNGINNVCRTFVSWLAAI